MLCGKHRANAQCAGHAKLMLDLDNLGSLLLQRDTGLLTGQPQRNQLWLAHAL